MHILTFVWIILWTSPLMSSARIDSRTDIDRHNNLLRAILWEERQFEDIEKRAYDSLETHTHLLPCCPTVKRRIAPRGGLSREGKLLELYRDVNAVQRFYETICHPAVADMPCRFIDPIYRSKCVQNYTYMYAIVKDFNVTEPFRVDYMRVKSGCTCKVEEHSSPAEIIQMSGN
ncbi:unnamed protein product [Mytilus coruscus]|uniref:Spaetzle domain-containing protein n=1 Tax=Mytilus coruscus TaxID=42192 RepID=A0A6J8EDA5_MYTCO|nr:unnamed protein product [Mytilus coruscus]